VKARRSHIFPKAADGHYVEPAWCSERLFAIESFGAPGALVLDPAAGWGNIPRAAAAAGYTAVASDIVDRLDRRGLEGVRFHICNFLKESPVRSAWSIACNPHFDHIREFCERGLEIATYKVAMIMPLAGSQPRAGSAICRSRPSTCSHRGHLCRLASGLRPATFPAAAARTSAGSSSTSERGRWPHACAGCRALAALGGSSRRPAWCSLRLLHANVGRRL
jgi:hypothetical protein